MVTSKKYKTVLSQPQAQGTESSQLPPGGLWDKTKEAAAAKEMSLKSLARQIIYSTSTFPNSDLVSSLQEETVSS